MHLKSNPCIARILIFAVSSNAYQVPLNSLVFTMHEEADNHPIRSFDFIAIKLPNQKTCTCYELSSFESCADQGAFIRGKLSIVIP